MYFANKAGQKSVVSVQRDSNATVELSECEKEKKKRNVQTAF